MPLEQSLHGRRVLFVIHSFDRGGSGRVAAYLANGFAALGMTVDLLVFARGGEVEHVAEVLAGDTVSIQYLNKVSGFRPFDLVRGFSALVRVLRQSRPDVVVACANNTALVTAIAHRLAGLRGALFLKTTNPIASSRHRGAVRRIRLLSYRLIFRWARSVLTLSAEESEEMRAAYPQFPNLFVDVANPYVTPAMFALPRPLLPRARQGKTVISVARLTRQKRLERLIAAFAEVRDPDARLLILGEGEERETLIGMVAALGLTERVSMPGYIDDVASALHEADLFVLPSDYEGLPAVILEAMAANCPVLSTDCFPAARALLANTEGCAIIEDTSPASLARLIDTHLRVPRPDHLRDIARRYSIENGIASHANAVVSAMIS